MTNATVNTISASDLCALTSGDGNELPTQYAPAFRSALVAAGFGNTDTSEIPSAAWNAALDVVAVEVASRSVGG